MNELLINVLAERRQAAGKNGQPLSYAKFAKVISGQMHGSTLYRFIRGEKNLHLSQVRLIAAWAQANRDDEILGALAVYALGQDVLVVPVDN